MITNENTLWLALSASGEHAQLFLTLFVMYVAAKLAAEIFERLKQPAVAGEILAGVLIGPSVLGWVVPSDVTNTLSEIGVVFLLFLVGLETKPTDIFRVGARASLVAVLGVLVPFAAGWGLAWLWGRPQLESIFIGAAMVATSVGITARVLAQMGLLHLKTSRIILGAAVIDDVLGLIILAIVSSVAQGGVNYLQIGTTAVLAIGFTILVALVGTRAINRIRRRVEKLRVGHSWLVFGLSVCLGLVLLAHYIGVAAIIGAFLAGMSLSEATEDTDMPHQAEAVTEFLLPFFLTNIGMQLRLDVFLQGGIVGLALLVTVFAVLTKLIGCGLGAWSLGRRKAMQIGMGMVPRGEVGIVVAQLGLSLGAVSDAIYGVVLVMAVATTLIAPPFLVRLFQGEKRVPEDPLRPVTQIS
jgi:Kef-type K+ transport system membrane component KefB